MNAFTYIGYAPITASNHNQFAIYDGHSSPQAEGTIDEVVAHLRSMREWVKLTDESLRWEGHNGFYAQGGEAVRMVDAEIAALQDGSHFSLEAAQ